MLLYKQVPSIDLVDHDDFYSDTIRQHELEERKRQPTLLSVILVFGICPEAPWQVHELAQPSGTWHPDSRGL